MGTGPFYFAVADGISTSTQARKASGCLLEMLAVALVGCDADTSLGPILHQLHQDYCQLGRNPSLLGMASTLAGGRVVGNKVTVFNVGDSRAYVLQPSPSGYVAHQLSHDHSVLQGMIDEGEISQAEAGDAASFLRGLSAQFVADPLCDEFALHLAHHTWQAGELLLVCSDGLTEALSDTKIAALLGEQAPTNLAEVCKAARRAGGRDDFSVVVLMH